MSYILDRIKYGKDTKENVLDINNYSYGNITVDKASVLNAVNAKMSV